MITIILPGYSKHNKEWAEETRRNLNLLHKVLVHDWKHWTGGNFSLQSELNRITKEISEDQVNIIAKSVGVYVALNLIPKISIQVEKVILCGIASVVSDDRNELALKAFSQIGLKNLLCIQNENDKYVSFSEAERFYHSINPEVKVVSKPRSDHEYPYFKDFQGFLKK